MALLSDARAGTSRLDLRRQVSDLLGDLKIATATSGGSTTTFVDASRLAAPLNAFMGREALFTGGTVANLGQVRFVSGSTTGGQLTFAALPSATAANDEIELRNVRHQGWGADEIHRAINTALSDAWAGIWEPVQETLSTFSAASGVANAAFSVNSPTLDLPNSFAYVFSVEWQDSLGYWHSVPPTTMTDEPGWVLVPGGQVQINGNWAWDADGAAIRITGYKRFAPLLTDADTTTVNAEWLRHQAAAYLLLQGRERMGDNNRAQLYLTYQSRADRLRDLLSGAPANGTQAVRP